MRVIVKQTLVVETKRHDFDNGFSYIEKWINNSLKDCYFADKADLFVNGEVKPEGVKYFYAPYSDKIEKVVKPINPEKFDSFGNLFFIDCNGDLFNIDGSEV